MNSAAKIGISLAMLLVSTAVIAKASQTNNLVTKFKLNPQIPNNARISNGLLNINFPVQIINQSTFDVTIQNLYVNVSYKDSDGIWQDLFYQANAVKQVDIKKLVPTNLNTIPLSMPLTNVFTLLDIFTGKLSKTLLVSTRFQAGGVEIAPILTQIDAGVYLKPIIAVLKKFGLGETSEANQTNLIPTELGYSANGFHYRKIQDASAYQNLISKATGKDTVIRKNGSAYDTIEDMAKIVNETLLQTKALADSLKGTTREETVKNIYTWLHNHIQYKKDKEGEEQLREPIRSFADRQSGIDCDCFAIFASSLLLNSGINNYIEMCMIHPDPWFKHVYVIVPKTQNASIKQRSNYWVVDACLHSFDELAPNISLKFDRPMNTTRLSGLDCAGKTNCGCPSKPTGTYGNSSKPLQPITVAKTNEMELAILEPMRQNLIQTKQQAINNPGSMAMMYDPKKIVQGVDYALANWNDSGKREAALDVLAQQDEAMVNRPVLNGLMGAGAFRGFDGVDYDPTQVYPLMGFDDNTGNLHLEGFGGLFKSIKKTAQSVKAHVKSVASNAVKAVQKAAVNTGNGIKVGAQAVAKASKAAASSVAQAAKFVANNIQKLNPGMVAARTAFRGLVALNFRGMASDIAKSILTEPGMKKVKDFWTGPFVGGNWGDLISAVNAGKNKKRLLGSAHDNLGIVVATGTAASVVAATPIIVKIATVLKDALKFATPALTKIKSLVDFKNKTAEAIQTAKSLIPSSNRNSSDPLQPDPSQNDPSQSDPTGSDPFAPHAIDPEIQSTSNNSDPDRVQIPSADPGIKTGSPASQTDSRMPSSSNTGLLVGIAAVVIAAIGFAVTSGNSSKSLKGIPSYSI